MATPKRQPYPATRIKVGAVLYSAYATANDGKVESGINEWVVRNIRARRNSKTVHGMPVANFGKEVPKVVNLAEKNPFTWGKRSKKTGDVGWLPNIWSGWRQQFEVGTDLPAGFYTTKRAALAYAIADHEQQAVSYAEDIANETDEDELIFLKEIQAEIAAQIQALKRRAKALAKSS